MHRRYLLLAIISVLLALGCFRLSKWQMDRLAQRRARNALLAERQAAAPAALAAIPTDTAQGHYRRVTVQGVFDYDRELALALRSRDGSPGVYLLTPLRLADGSTVLTNRGWVYAPDGMDVDFARWRDDDSVAVEGFLDTYVEPRGRVTLEGRPQLVRRLVRDRLEEADEPGQRRALLERADGTLGPPRRPGREHHDLAVRAAVDARLGARRPLQRALVELADGEDLAVGPEVVPEARRVLAISYLDASAISPVKLSDLSLASDLATY